jgi:hypothetical protein
MLVGDDDLVSVGDANSGAWLVTGISQAIAVHIVKDDPFGHLRGRDLRCLSITLSQHHAQDRKKSDKGEQHNERTHDELSTGSH